MKAKTPILHGMVYEKSLSLVNPMLISFSPKLSSSSPWAIAVSPDNAYFTWSTTNREGRGIRDSEISGPEGEDSIGTSWLEESPEVIGNSFFFGEQANKRDERSKRGRRKSLVFITGSLSMLIPVFHKAKPYRGARIYIFIIPNILLLNR
ncbi:MAG: hypothetical protein WCS91_03570 [Bacilli bacterium]